MKELTKDWIRAARDDLTVIEKILEDESLTHIVAFHAQQCVEKVFKALLEEHEVAGQKIHNLVTLLAKTEQWFPYEIDMKLLRILDSLYIEARYPSEFGLLPSGRPTLTDASAFYEFARSIFETIDNQLKSI